MAGNEVQRNFRKLKLDTTGWHILPSKDSVEATGIPVPASQILGRTGTRNLQAKTVIPEEAAEDVTGSLPRVGDGGKDEIANHGSIIFESQISPKDGQEEPVVEPVAREGKSPKRRNRSIMQELAHAQNKADSRNYASSHAQSQLATESDPHPDGNPSPYRKGEPRWPLLQTTADELAEERDRPQDLTLPPDRAASGFSPVCDGVGTAGYFSGEFSQPSSIASSPIQFPTLSDSGILSSPKTRDGYRRRDIGRPGSLRRESRRSSARSSIAKSPASSFLAQFSKASAAPEADEDGQTIGEYGEYVIGRQIGYGGFSVIKEVYSFENQQQIMRAVKIVRKHVASRCEVDNDKLQGEFGNEVSIWRFLKHPNILPLVAVFSNPFATFCIMEMSTGGTLFDLVRSHRRTSSASLSPGCVDCPEHMSIHQPHVEAGLPTKLVQHYLRQLASALRYLHQDMHIVHRDIKLENCLVSTQSTDLEYDPGMKIRLCDFGMADFINADGREEDAFDNLYGGHVDPANEDFATHIIGPSDLSTNIAGSLEYASPELIRASEPLYLPSVDIWAFGIVSHALLMLDLPFRHSLQPKLQMMILQGLWDRQRLAEACRADSSGAELVQHCLDLDAHGRWDIGDVVKCTFLA